MPYEPFLLGVGVVFHLLADKSPVALPTEESLWKAIQPSGPVLPSEDTGAASSWARTMELAVPSYVRGVLHVGHFDPDSKGHSVDQPNYTPSENITKRMPPIVL